MRAQIDQENYRLSLVILEFLQSISHRRFRPTVPAYGHIEAHCYKSFSEEVKTLPFSDTDWEVIELKSIPKVTQ